MRDLRQLSTAALRMEACGLCSAVWTGDFGTGQPTGSGVWSDPGVNPCKLHGPLPTAGTTGNGVLLPPFKLGMIVDGDLGAEFVLGKLVLASTTDLLPGQGYFLDKDFNLTLTSGTNASNVLNAEVGVLNVWGPQTPAGTYWAWIQRAGHCSVQAAASSAATGSAETVSGVSGQFKFPTTATSGQKNALPMTAYNGSSAVTFTGNTTSGSPYITGVVSVSGGAANPLDDLQVGQVITGTGLPANAIIAAIDKQGSGWRVTIGTNTAGSYNVLQNATASGSGVTFTVTSHLTANVYWPTFVKQN
jgi:hypothetical protein